MRAVSRKMGVLINLGQFAEKKPMGFRENHDTLIDKKMQKSFR